MYDRNAILDIIETAENTQRACYCGAPMVPAGEAGAIWLVCSDRPAPRNLRSRLTSLDWITRHDRVLLLAADELGADERAVHERAAA